MGQGLREQITNYPEVFYHGTDLVYSSMPEDFRKLYLEYCKYFRETLYPKFYQYHPIGERNIRDWYLSKEHQGLVPVLLPVKQVSARLNRYKHIFCRADGYIWIKNIE